MLEERRLSRRALLRASARAGIGAAGLALVGCANEAAEPSGGEQAVVQWGYAGETGPDRWADLSGDYAACAEGERQSPIDLRGAQPAGGAAPSFDYRGESTHLEHLAHSVHIRFGDINTLTTQAGEYLLRQIHWHTPSEHRVDGASAPMELHLVHTRGSGEVAVVGVFYELGEADPAIQRWIEATPPKAPSNSDDVHVAARDFQPRGAACYHYDGSLTTPPCTEAVDWFVMRERRTISAAQLAALSELTAGDNNRPLQPLNGRRIELLG